MNGGRHGHSCRPWLLNDRCLWASRSSPSGAWRRVETLGITRLSKSQVSVMARELDEVVADFRSRPLDADPYTSLATDA
jgi:transposase-like protein